MTEKELFDRLTAMEEEEADKVNQLHIENAEKTITEHKKAIEAQMQVLKEHMDSGSRISKEMMNRWNALIDRKEQLENKVLTGDAKNDPNSRENNFFKRGWGRVSAFLKSCVDYVKDADGHRAAHREEKALLKEERARAAHRASIADQVRDVEEEIEITTKDLEKAQTRMENADRRASDRANAKTAVSAMFHNMFHKDKVGVELKSPEDAHNDRGFAASRVQRLMQKLDALKEERGNLQKQLEHFRDEDGKSVRDKNKEQKEEKKDKTLKDTAKEAEELTKSEVFTANVKNVLMEEGMPEPGKSSTYEVQTASGQTVNVEVSMPEKGTGATIMYEGIDITKGVVEYKSAVEVASKASMTQEVFEKFFEVQKNKTPEPDKPQEPAPDVPQEPEQKAPQSEHEKPHTPQQPADNAPEMPKEEAPADAGEPKTAKRPQEGPGAVGKETDKMPEHEPDMPAPAWFVRQEEEAFGKRTEKPVTPVQNMPETKQSVKAGPAKNPFDAAVDKVIKEKKTRPSRNDKLFGEDWRKEARDAMRSNPEPTMPER